MNGAAFFSKMNEGVLGGLSAIAARAERWEVLKSPLVQALNSTLQSSLHEGRQWLEDLPPLSDPHLWAAYIQQKQPELAKALLRAAAIAQNPQREWMGVRILYVDSCEVRALMLRPPKLEGKILDGGGLLTMANIVAEVFWRQFLELAGLTFCTKEQLVRLLRPEAEGPLRARISVGDAVREGLFFQLRAEGSAQLPNHLDILDSRDLVVAEVEWQWQVTQPASLTEGPARSTND